METDQRARYTIVLLSFFQREKRKSMCKQQLASLDPGSGSRNTLQGLRSTSAESHYLGFSRIHLEEMYKTTHWLPVCFLVELKLLVPLKCWMAFSQSMRKSHLHQTKTAQKPFSSLRPHKIRSTWKMKLSQLWKSFSGPLY